jgi:hypothetical protein
MTSKCATASSTSRLSAWWFALPSRENERRVNRGFGDFHQFEECLSVGFI